MRIADDPASPFEEDAGHRFDGTAVAPGRDPYSREPDPADTWFLWRHYLGPDERGAGQAWRRIDGDWLASAPELALQLDSRTNNSSLVIAFEIAETGHVLLFAADAQVGNWLTWPEIVFPVKRDGASVTGADPHRADRLLQGRPPRQPQRDARTEGVGADGRIHARRLQPDGRILAGRVGWKDFPAPKLTARLRERTKGRYIQSDEP